MGKPHSVSGLLDAERLEASFAALAPLLVHGIPRAPKQIYSIVDLQAAFDALHAPLAAARSAGGLINPWTIAGLKRDEVRIASALAGLWRAQFGGASSLRFLGEYLSAAIGHVDWHAELASGYRVEAECNPLGLASDRVDLVVETARHLIGIEVKVDAALGPMQLERYALAIERRAELQGREPHNLLLARSASAAAVSTSWRDIASAAGRAVPRKASARGFVDQYIASFGDFVRIL
jgi:hypothetical protein